MFTLSDLEDYYDNVNSYNARQKEIEALFNNNVHSPRLGGTPGGTGPGNPTERIVDLKLQLEEENDKLLQKRIEINRWLESDITDEQVKTIVRLHYLQHRSWKQASRIACNSINRSTAQMIVFRYFEKSNNTR